MRMMIGILSPTSGSCNIGDTQSNRFSAEERAPTGYMAQLKSFLSDLTARENLDFFVASLAFPAKLRICKESWFASSMIE